MARISAVFTGSRRGVADCRALTAAGAGGGDRRHAAILTPVISAAAAWYVGRGDGGGTSAIGEMACARLGVQWQHPRNRL